ncbi:carboxylating nicotinate-nucleotide diphosphorylase [uncultured Methanoregula sp.]|uniref:carboxylating nicotinate-nucleotide diphosphorylase n=1 Tax=uncultured Methanoregula sp. TaxID=1005933 RepID=UPI002AAB5B78|nr:carboxylating nicotinate-nucleotide diphosphorylase [uncultured Methanoregula sp.]
MVPIHHLLSYIDEDAPFGDITSEAIIPDVNCSAVIRAEQSGVIAGLEEAAALFEYFQVVAERKIRDGEDVRTGDVVLVLSGNAKKILLVERTALNIIGRMSGIASQTRKMVNRITTVSPSCRIACTRKTAPGFRVLDKKAVILGGGDPHRTSLSDGILIKDNHLALVPLETAIHKARAVSAYRIIEVEVETPVDAKKAAEAGSDIILLDNMSPEQIRATVELLRSHELRERVVLEVSGGVDENSLHSYAACGIDTISMGALTHTVRNFSVTLEIQP